MEHSIAHAGSSHGSHHPSSTSNAKKKGSNGSQNQHPSSAKRPNVSEAERDDEEEADSPAPELDEHYVTMRTDVVGVQYYRGMVGRGEYVMLRRQPGNQYDRNAVQVINASGVQVGHIPRAVAAEMAWLMDEKLISVEGRMIGQNLDGAKHYKLAMDMSIYARPSLREVLEPELVWATPGQRGFEAMRQGLIQGGGPPKGKGKARGGDTGVAGPGNSGVGLPQAVDPEMQKLLDGLKKVGEDEKQADNVMDSLTADIDVGKLPLHPDPPGIASGHLVVDLLPHQSQALQWMIGQENPKLPATPEDSAVQFWAKQKGDPKAGGGEYWLNVATRTPQKDTPKLGRGGILADGMGLGKTLSVLSLVLATKSDPTAAGYSNSTLIVCPLSVLSNWEKQIRDHVIMGKLSLYTYHGESRGVTAATLQNYDIVLTTYQAVSADASSDVISKTPVKGKKAKTTTGPLLKAKWKRVVADEGHVLKNPKAKMTQAFAALVAERRWVCTGTPIVNSLADLGSILTCLQLCNPLDKPEYFKTLLLRPVKNGSGAAGKLLQALVAQILLRRTKESKDAGGNRLVELPPIEYFQASVRLDEETREMYDEIQRASAEALLTGQSTANVLSMLTRMRQLCLSRQLVPQSFFDDLRRPPIPAKGDAVPISSISEEKKQGLVDKLRQKVADDEDCSICFDAPMKDPNITDCGHTFCFPCIDEWLHRDTVCPFCRHTVTTSSLLALPAEESEFVEPAENPSAPATRSAKIEELIKYLKVFDTKDKTLVFSQFTSFLDLVAGSLKDAGIHFCRFDGSMNAKRRQEVIADFQRPVTERNASTNPRVMLISLKSGAVGLNLTAASNVFLCDPWWQSAIEAQAIDRVHRMGQRKPVRVFQLIAEDTIESRVLDIQKRKDALVAKAFEKSSKGESKKDKKQARLEDLKELLGLQ